MCLLPITYPKLIVVSSSSQHILNYQIFKILLQVLVPVANGCEEIEVVTIIDILRRAKANVAVASVGKSLQVLASNGTKLMADKMISAAADSVHDLIILPVRFLYLYALLPFVDHNITFNL